LLSRSLLLLLQLATEDNLYRSTEALLCMASEKTKDYLKSHALGSSGRRTFRLIKQFALDKSIALVRLARPTARTELPANLAFTLLPFKASFALTTIYKHKTKSSDFDRHLVFFCGHRIRDHFDWVVIGPLAKRYFNEIFLYLILSGYQKEALSLFPRIDWRHCEDYFVDGLERLIQPILSGYSMDLLAQIHSIGWEGLSDRARKHFAELVKLMLEHRNFDYEERIFAGKQLLDDKLEGVPIDKYTPLFFKDKELVQTLASELELTGVAETIASLDADGQYWESFPKAHPQRHILSDISQFYAYRHLMLRTYHNGEGHLVSTLHKKSMETQKRLRRSLPAPSPKLKNVLDGLGIELPDVKLLSPDWGALIGHNGHLHVHLMMREMGWWKGSPLLLAYKDRIANKPFLSLFSQICPTLTLGENVSDDVWHELAGLTPFLGESHQAFAFEDGRAMYWNDAGGAAVNRWDAEGRGFPLRDIYDHRLLSDESPETILADLRKKWGMAPEDWYVCLHMRDASTRGDTVGAGESIRNTTFENYITAVRYITDQGGWVIRMGGSKAPALPPMARVIDYARSPHQMPKMDIHLVRKARMFIGTTSGFAYVASNFGIPTAMVNTISSVGLLWSVDTRFALKPIHTRDGRMLSQREATSEQWRWAYPTHESLARVGLTVSENSADEIHETVKEVFALTTGNVGPSNSALIEAWRAAVSIPGFYGSALPSTYFLEKYRKEFFADVTASHYRIDQAMSLQ
jgi:putative glycosyltransferase (TIGR04372 family)